MFHVFLHFPFECSLQLVCPFENVFDGAELRDEFDGCLFAHAGAAWYVVGCIAHQAEHVDHLVGVFNAVFLAHFFRTENLHGGRAVARTAHQHVGAHELGVVLVGGDHVDLQPFIGSFQGERANHVVGFETFHFKDGDAVGFDDALDDGHGLTNVLRGGFALGLVFGVGFVAECTSGRVEGNADVVGVFIVEQHLEGVDETVDGRCVLAFGVDSRRADQGIVGTVYECVSVEKIKGFHAGCEHFCHWAALYDG